MDADLELEKIGLPIMQMHRVQQGHNLVRMDLQTSQREVAIRLAGELLAYLERQIDALPYHYGWRSLSLQSVPLVFLRAMIHQVVSETVSSVVIHGNSAGEWNLFLEACRLHKDPEMAIFPQVQYALGAQLARLTGCAEVYLRNLESFFGLGIRLCPLLWYAIMIELVSFCCEMNTCLSRQVRDVILRDSVKWKGIPSFLRDRLSYAPAQ